MFSENVKHGVRRRCSVMQDMLRECAMNNAYRHEPINQVGKACSLRFYLPLLERKAFETVSNRLEDFVGNF